MSNLRRQLSPDIQRDYEVYRPARDVMNEAMRLRKMSDEGVSLREALGLIAELAAIVDDLHRAYDPSSEGQK